MTRSPRIIILGTAVLTLVCAFASPATAVPPASLCQAGRLKATGLYRKCHQNAAAKWLKTGGVYNIQKGASKCHVKYAKKWTKLQQKFATTGTSCDQPRLVDNGDGTVSDRLSGLQWEKKTGVSGLGVDCSLTACPDPHDVNNSYQWSTALFPANGGAFTDFLAKLNTACFAGHCDWRVPTLAELQTILNGPYLACASTPCIDPIFGPTKAADYWSDTTGFFYGGTPFTVSFAGSFVSNVGSTGALSVRAVRGDLFE